METKKVYCKIYREPWPDLASLRVPSLLLSNGTLSVCRFGGVFDLWRNGVLPFVHPLDPRAPPRLGLGLELELELCRRLLVFALSSILMQRGQDQILILRLNLDRRSKTDRYRPREESVNVLDRVYKL